MKSRTIILVCLFGSTLSMLFGKQEHLEKLVAINDVSPSIRIECKYASYDNFTGQRLYPAQFYSRTYLLKEVALQLDKVQKELEKQGLGLLIWDAFRPLEGQRTLWDICPDERFVAHPDKGGFHTRGTTVDLTIINLADGKPLDMGTGFDVFTDRSASFCPDISQLAKANRKLLRDIMAKYGFNAIECEWWHFNYLDPAIKVIGDHRELVRKLYPVLEVDFNELD